MLYYFRLFVYSLLLILTTSCSSLSSNPFIEQGHVIYSYKSGKMECLSEIDGQGNLCILLKSLSKNTEIEFYDVNRLNDKTVILTTVISVEDENAPCARWVDVQEVQLEINPIQVNQITLQGNPIYNKGGITILKS